MKFSKLLLFITFFSLCKLTIAQSWKDEFNTDVSLSKKGKYKEALVQLLKSKNSFDTDSLSKDYAVILYAIGDTYFNIENYDSSFYYLEKSIELHKQLLNENSPQYEALLSKIGLVKYRINDYKQALEYFEKDVVLSEKIYENNSKEYMVAASNLANTFNKLKKYTEAEKYYIKVLKIKEHFFGKVSSEYSSTLNWLATLYMTTKDYEKAKPICIEAIKIRKQLSGTNNQYYLNNLVRLADCYIQSQEYAEAKTLNLEIIELINSKKDSINLVEQSNSKNIDNYYFNALIGLQEIYIRLGEFNNAEEISTKFEKVFRIRNNNDPHTHSQFLMNQGFLNLEIFKYVEAFDFFTQALAIHTDDTSKQSKKSIANDFNNIGEVFRRIQEYDKASTYYKKAITYLYSSGDTTDITVLALLHNLSLCYISVNKIDSSLICEYEAIHFFEKFELDKKKPHEFAQSLLNITNLNLNKKDTGTALFYFEKLIKSSKYLSKEELVTYWDISSKIYDSHNNYANAIGCQRNSTYQKKINLLEYCKFSNTLLSSLKEEYSSTININYLDLLIKKNPISVDTNYLLAHIYNYEILKKALNLKYELSFNNYFRQSENIEQYRIYQEIIYRKDKLNALAYLQDSISVNTKKQLDYEIDSIEELLLKKSDFYLDLTRKFNINRKDIQSNLPSDAIAIEFLFDNENYAALVLKPNNEQPYFVRLCEQKQIIEILNNKVKTVSSIDSLYSYNLKGKLLYNLIWKNLDSVLKNYKTIYAAPSGLLHNVNLAAVPINDSTLFGNKYDLHLITTTADVVEKKVAFFNNSYIKEALIFGGIDYDNINEKIIAVRHQDSTFNQLTKNITRSYNNKWSFMRSSLTEASTIDSLCGVNKLNSHFVYGVNASEAKFKELCSDSANKVVHIATHGFFFPKLDLEEKENEISIRNSELLKKFEDPLLRCGLILSGANKMWGKQMTDFDGVDDGILTGLEIANLNLNRTNLVVLSACKTGLGDIDNTEGSFGLQRSFKLAGAKNIIMSLWDIPDAQTKELMILFYENYFKGMAVSNALQNAQFVMSKKYSPYYWAGFVLLE